MYNIPFTKLDFTICFTKSGELYENKSSAIRGGIGQMLLLEHCLGDSRQCDVCAMKKRCIVQNIMYASYQIKPAFVTNQESMGFVLYCQDRKKSYRAGDKLKFTITLFADVIAMFSPLLHAIFALGQTTGLGKEQLTFQIASVKNRKGDYILSNGNIYKEKMLVETVEKYVSERERVVGDSFTVEFQSPCAIRYRGELLQHFELQAIGESLKRRLYMLQCFVGEKTELVTEDLPEMQFKVLEETQSHVSRYSAAKHAKMQLQGIRGRVRLEQVPNDWKRLFLAGEILLLGKNTRLGFGVYRIKGENKNAR